MESEACCRWKAATVEMRVPFITWACMFATSLHSDMSAEAISKGFSDLYLPTLKD